ncbi:hypothetical protein Peur_043023 [Populus x canadensis]
MHDDICWLSYDKACSLPYCSSGGAHDREAQSFALRTAKNPQSSSNSYASVYDEEFLRRVRTEMPSDDDLILAGRCHETEPEALSNLSEWMNLRELGPIGDILASEDISSI